MPHIIQTSGTTNTEFFVTVKPTSLLEKSPHVPEVFYTFGMHVYSPLPKIHTQTQNTHKTPMVSGNDTLIFASSSPAPVKRKTVH